MAIKSLDTWQSSYARRPKVNGDQWEENFADWYIANIVGITTDPSVFVSTDFVFTFNKALFVAGLLKTGKTNNSTSGIKVYADAWETVIKTVLFPAFLNFTTGPSASHKPPTATPATTFSVINTLALIPASIVAGKAKIMELSSVKGVLDPKNSQFPVKFREATLLLKVNIAGLDNTPPSTGPLSLSLPIVPLV